MILNSTWSPNHLDAAFIIGLVVDMFMESSGLKPLDWIIFRRHDRGAVERLDHQDVARKRVPHVLSGTLIFALPEGVFLCPIASEGSVRVGRGERVRVQEMSQVFDARQQSGGRAAKPSLLQDVNPVFTDKGFSLPGRAARDSFLPDALGGNPRPYNQRHIGFSPGHFLPSVCTFSRSTSPKMFIPPTISLTSLSQLRLPGVKTGFGHHSQ